MKINSNSTKRNIPTADLLNWREEYIKSIDKLKFEEDYINAPLLEHGNTKIGYSSKYYDKVFVWNLPIVITCPNASMWCLRHCYNADLRQDKFPINQWNKNLQFYLNNRGLLENKIMDILSEPHLKIAVRIHSSGDFFEVEYVKFWHKIIQELPNVTFWAYTRSWQDEHLFKVLGKLKQLPNIQVFASWDFTMPLPPEDWRKSIVYNENDSVDDKGIVCPEQSGQSPNCATCNYCLTKKTGNVYFILH